MWHAVSVRRSVPRFLLFGVITVLLGAALSAFAAVAPPAAYADVYISGRVVDANGDPAVGVQADAFKWDGDSWEGAGWSLTDDQGSYTRVLPEAGLYRICFWDLAGVWVSEWYNDATFSEDAVTFDLADGASRTGVNAVLVRAGTISGTVTNAGGDPLEGIEVDVFHYYPQIDEWRGCGQVTTGADGTYSHPGLTPGVHHVLFHDPSDLYADEDYNDNFHNEGFDNVEVLAGQTTGGIDASLEEAATISGYVTGHPAMTPLTGIHVAAFRYVEGMGWSGIMDTYTVSGAYQIGGLPPGSYRLQFEDQNDIYLDEWWEDTYQWDDATAFELNAGQRQGGMNADLAQPGHITGTVTGGGGAGALAGIHVTVHVMSDGQPGPPVAETWTGGDGSYDVGGLMPGVYRVRFEDSAAGLWVPQWYDGVRYPDAAADVTVPSGGVASGVDAGLLSGGAIAGTVRNEGATGLDHINVSVHQRIDGLWQWVDGTSSADDGTYRIGGLAPGAYRLTVNDRDGEYADETFENAVSLDQGRDIEVGAGSTAVADPVMDPGGRIIGQVADDHGQPLEGIDVVFMAWVDDQGVPGGGLWVPYSRTTTASNGFFNQSGIRPGANVVQFSDPDGGFLGEYFNDVENVEQAQQVVVTAGTTQGLGVVNLAHQGSISGRVANAQDEPLEGIEVDVFRWDDGAQDWVGCGVVTTGPDGTYTHGGLRAGMYQVWFRDPSGRYVGEAYDDVQPGPEQQPTQIPLGPGMAATGIDAHLELGGSISGMVTGLAAMPLSGIHVTAEHDISGGYGDWQGFSEAITLDGVYELGGLPAGTYRIRFWDDSGFYAPQFWEGVILYSEATLIDLPAGGGQVGVNASLTLAGHIAGTVTGAGAGPIQHVTVRVHRFNGEWYDWMGLTETRPDGSYDIGGLVPGAYRVSFDASALSEGYWASEWYLDAISMEEGQDVNVGDGGFVVADAELGAGGAITGTVRNESGEPLPWMDISAYRMRVEGDETFWDGIGGVQTAEDGTYRMGGLPPGTYQFEINDGWSGNYAVEVYENARNVGDGIDIPVIAGQDTTGVDPVLGLGGRIAGRVLDEGGQPLQSIMVQFDAWVDDPEGGHWEWYTETWTDAEGFFDMSGLVATRTLVHFTDESGTWASEYYDDAAGQDDAYQVIVTPGQLTAIGEVVLGPPARISGRVTGPEGQPLQGVEVMFNVWNPDGWWDGVDIGRPWPQTDENGHYEYSGLEPGLYQVWAQDPGGTYAMGGAFPEATMFAGQTTTVDLTMELGASISGFVTGGPLDEPLSGIWVTAERWVGDEYGGWQWAGGSGTESGAYEIRGLPAGTYRVNFWDESRVYAGEFWDGAWLSSQATSIDLDPGDSQSGVNATMVAGGRIAGTVTGEGAGPLGDVWIGVNAFNGEWWEEVAWSYTLDGSYDIGGLAPGTYRLYFAEQVTGLWASEWHLDAASPEEGVDVPVAAGMTTPLDVELAAGGSISGTVRTDGGDPLAWLDVGVSRLRVEGEDHWWEWVGGAQTAEDGTYRVGGLPPGAYRVEFQDWSSTYMRQVYADAADWDAGTDVLVVAGQDTPGIDAFLTAGAHLTGRVLDEGGLPLEGINVNAEVWDPDVDGGSWVTRAETYSGPNGRFDLAGAPAGKTLVRFQDHSMTYATEFYEDASMRAGATRVILTAGQSTDIGDVALWSRGAISGTVRDAQGAALEGLTVVFAMRNDEGWYDQLVMRDWPATDAEGRYEMPALDPGDYQVWVEDPGGTLLCESFPETVVLPGQTTTGVDIVMQVGAGIQGTVTDPGGAPVPGVTVGFSYGNYGDSAVTDENGFYSFRPMGAGSFDLFFDPPAGSGLHAEWWRNASQAEATWIEIGWGETLTLDAVLGPESDVLPPETQVAGADGAWHDTPVTLTLTGVDAGSSVERTEYRIDGRDWTSAEDGQAVVGAPADHTMDGLHTVWYRSTDAVGNVETAQSVEVRIDTTGPVLSGDHGDGWYPRAVTVGVGGTDAGEGTVSGIEYRLPGGDWTAGDSFTMRTWKRGGGSGEHLVDVRAVDGLGNVSEPQQLTVRLDARPPVTSDDSDGLPHAADVTVALAVDDPLSGRRVTYYSVDGAGWLRGNEVTVPALPGGLNDGTHVVRYFSVDNAGNVEQVRSCVVVIDTAG